MTRATVATINQTKDETTVTFAQGDESETVSLGKVGKSVSGRKVVDRALAKSGILPGPFLRYGWAS